MQKAYHAKKGVHQLDLNILNGDTLCDILVCMAGLWCTSSLIVARAFSKLLRRGRTQKAKEATALVLHCVAGHMSEMNVTR